MLLSGVCALNSLSGLASLLSVVPGVYAEPFMKESICHASLVLSLNLVRHLPVLIGMDVERNLSTGHGAIFAAIFAAMFLENVFPPIPSEVIMPPWWVMCSQASSS
jgi:hypothetical protein